MSTPSIFNFTDYKDYLNKYADSEPRGFKKRLSELSGCQTAYISHVLNGLAHFSWEQAEAISNGIGHTNDEKEYFLLILNYSNAGTPSLKKFIKGRLDKIRESHFSIKDRVKVNHSLSKEDQARYYSAWYFAAIHVMLTIPKFQTADAISHYLRIELKIVSEVLEFLVSLGLAVRHGSKFKIGTSQIHLEKDSPLISKHHSNWRIAAINSFEKGRDDDLHFSSVVTISEKDFHRIRAQLIEAIEGAVVVIKASSEEVTVAMTMDLFKI
jgi:uncharacterized protein (TIGR02147 family)